MANANTYCRVKWCRYPYAHITSAHKCGGCDAFGHGQMECGNPDAESLLTMLRETLLPQSMHCDIFGCIYPQTHTRESHHCHHCFRQDHGERDCIIKEMIYYSGKYNNLEVDLHGLDNVFFKEPAGMGCIIYIRKKDGRLKFLMMHSDNWGQYGAETNDVPRLNKFIEGLSEINNEVVDGFRQGLFGEMPDRDQTDDEAEQGDYQITQNANDIFDNYYPQVANNVNNVNSIKCPLCRTMNQKSKIKQIKGLSDTCSVCLTNSVSLYFPKCEHACVCQECYDQL